MTTKAEELAALAAKLDAMASKPARARAVLEGMTGNVFPPVTRDTILGWDERPTRRDLPSLGTMNGGHARPRSGGDQLSMEARLRLSEARFQTLVEQIPAVTFLAALGEGSNETYVSPHIESMLGFTQDEWLSDPLLWYRQLHPDDRGRWNDEYARGCQTGGPFRAECRFFARDGSVVWVHGEARIVHDETGRPLFLQGVAFDITESMRAHEGAQELLERLITERTAALRSANEALVREIAERKQVEEALRSSDLKLRHARKMEAIGRLAGGVAHDFNNILSVVISYADMLIEGVDTDTPLFDGLKQIEDAGLRAAALTQQLLAFSRQQVLQPKAVALNDVVVGITKMLARLIGDHITLETSLDPELGMVYIDPAQVEQVIVNLVVNARDAMPKGGRIRISTSNVGADESGAPTQIQLLVVDEGIGMDAAMLERIYEPFFTTKDVGKGTGLGLATVFGIVQQSGGRIDVDSEVGRGTTFRISFPRMTGKDEEEGHGPLQRQPRPGTETILVVEDEGPVRDLAVAILEREGYRVSSASGGFDALALCERAAKPFDLLITDVLMPVMDGHELAERVAATYPSTRILLMSGYPNDVLDPRETADRGVGFLRKPIRPRALAERVRTLLDERTQARARRIDEATVNG